MRGLFLSYLGVIIGGLAFFFAMAVRHG